MHFARIGLAAESRQGLAVLVVPGFPSIPEERRGICRGGVTMKAAHHDEIDLQEMPEQVLEKVKSAAKEQCSSACARAKDMVIRNPVPTVLGALVFGAAVGYLVYSRREHLTLPDRLVRETEAFGRRLSHAPGRISSLFHDGVEMASTGAGKASGYLHDIPAREALDSISTSLNRICNRLKFW